MDINTFNKYLLFEPRKILTALALMLAGIFFHEQISYSLGFNEPIFFTLYVLSVFYISLSLCYTIMYYFLYKVGKKKKK